VVFISLLKDIASTWAGAGRQVSTDDEINESYLYWAIDFCHLHGTSIIQLSAKR
jgi:hypothetical protein